MADVLQRADDPRVAPRGILLGHPHHQAPDFREHASTARRGLRVRPFPGNELPVPAQERISGDDRGDLTQPPTAQAVRPHGKPASIVIGQLQASASELPTQDTVLFNEIAEYVSLLAVQPPDEDGEQQLQRRGINHGGNLYHGPGFHAPSRPSIQPWDTTRLRRNRVADEFLPCRACSRAASVASVLTFETFWCLDRESTRTKLNDRVGLCIGLRFLCITRVVSLIASSQGRAERI